MDKLVKKAVEHSVKHFLISPDCKNWASVGTLLQQNVLNSYLNHIKSCEYNYIFVNDKFYQHDFLPPKAPVLQHHARAVAAFNGNLPIVGVFLAGGRPLCQVIDSCNRFSSLVETLPATHINTVMMMDPRRRMDDFDALQKCRKQWWRGLLTHPERLSMEINKDLENQPFEQQIHIVSESLGVNLETLTMWKPQMFESDEMTELRPQISVKNQRKSVLPAVVTSSLQLQAASLYFIVDGYHSDSVQQLLLHHDIAPYKLGFVVEESSQTGELLDLARFLARRFRKICPNLLPIEAKWTATQCDARGVPFSVVLNAGTLHTGVCFLRNRNTMIQEQIHVGMLEDRLKQVFDVPS